MLVDLGFSLDRLSPRPFAVPGHYTTCAKRTPPPEEPTGGGDENEKSEGEDAARAHEATSDREAQWMLFDDKACDRKDVDYVTGLVKNQRNCYMALYELG